MNSPRLLPRIAFALAAVTPAFSEVVINEIHADEADKSVLGEFVELHNTAATAADVSGWALSGGVGYMIPAVTSIAPGGYLVLAQDPTTVAMQFSYPSALGPWTGRLSNSGERITLRNEAGAKIDEVDYKTGFPWPTVGEAPSPSLELLQPALDNDLAGSWRSSVSEPTPGAVNSVFTVNAPPAVRQVEHTPESPTPGTPVIVSAKITDPDGVDTVTLSYQIVEPGDYIAIDDPRYETGWTPVAMADDGSGTSTYSATLPAGIQTHRRLIRYRIAAGDSTGVSISTPYADDPSPNFAYFVYGTLPTWTAADQPGTTSEITYDFAAMEPVPVYQLITTRDDHEISQHIPESASGSGYTGSQYQWKGALVYDGVVYDHIRYRARGGIWRYAMGKNMWKFDLNRGHRFQARDDYGRRYKTAWRKLNFSSLIQQEDNGMRGEQGLFESTGFKIHNLFGSPAPRTNFVHFRIVEHADEAGPTDSQYDTDFQGLYLAIEQMDGQFIEEHDLPDGNLYKIENGIGRGNGDLNSQGIDDPGNNDDLVAFTGLFSSGTPQQTWEEVLDLQSYYSFYASVAAVRDNDIQAGKNYFFYRRPEDPGDALGNKWTPLNWDLDLTWTATHRRAEPTDGPLDNFIFRYGDFGRDYRNRLRDMVDLLFNPDQAGKLIDECARPIYTPGQPSFVDADRAMWDYNPIMASSYVTARKSGQGKFYDNNNAHVRGSPNEKTFQGVIDGLKTFITTRREDFLDTQSRHLRGEASTIPATPSISYTGLPGFPTGGISLASSAFDDPNGAGTFAAMRWRIGEIYHDGTANYVPGERFVYEIEPVWDSPVSGTFTASTDVPANVLRAGRTYRARVQHQDSQGNWGHWSAPLEFVATAPDVSLYENSLVLSEILYKPREATAEEISLGYETSDFEWIELQNISGSALDLTDVRFTKGVDLDIPEGTSLAAGAYAMAVRNADAFVFRYGSTPVVIGSYGPDSLSNGGETVKLSLGAGTPIHEFIYDDVEPWPAAADTGDVALVLLDPGSAPDHALPESWTASTITGGTPGRPNDSGDPYLIWKTENGISSNLDDSDGDDLPALLEFVLNTLPTEFSRTSLTITAGEFSTLTFTRRTDLGNVSLDVETSSNLEGWTALAGSAREPSVDNLDGTTTETWRLVGEGRSFARLRATF